MPAFAPAHAKNFEASRRALREARQQAALQHAQSAAARRQAAADAARAAMLAQQQVAAASGLRQLENQTAQAAATFDNLVNQGQSAAQELKQNEAALAALLPVMVRLAREPAATMLAIPASPNDAIRGVLVLQGIASEIESRAKAVRQETVTLAALQMQTKAQQARLAAAAATQQQAEATLGVQITAAHQAETQDLDIAARTAAAEAAATQNVRNLQSVIENLQLKERVARATAPVRLPAPQIVQPAGAPVAGELVQAYGAATIAGPAVGIVYRAAPGAQVISPCSGPVLYANRFQNYGLLVILDCGRNYDFVLSGMQHLDVIPGQQIARGQPLGQMAGYDAADPAAQPTLYVELRQDGKPVNPAIWLNGGGSG